MSRTWIVAAAAAAVLSGCASPLHLTYDYGRAYTEAVVSQADLTRTSVANSAYRLYGQEAEQIRIQVQEKSTDQETDESELD